MAVDAAEHCPIGDAGGVEPGAERWHGEDLGRRAEGQRYDASPALLVDLVATDRQRDAVGAEGEVGDGEGKLRKAPAGLRGRPPAEPSAKEAARVIGAAGSAARRRQAHQAANTCQARASAHSIAHGWWRRRSWSVRSILGCHHADDDSDDAQVAPTEQASISGAEVATTASTDVGEEQFARGGGTHGETRGGRGGGGHGGAAAGLAADAGTAGGATTATSPGG